MSLHWTEWEEHHLAITCGQTVFLVDHCTQMEFLEHLAEMSSRMDITCVTILSDEVYEWWRDRLPTNRIIEGS